MSAKEDSDAANMTRIQMIRDGEWFHLFDMPDVVYAAAKKPGNDIFGSVCFMGRKGLYREVSSGNQPTDVQLTTWKSGYLHDLRYIGSHLYACGTHHQVHTQQGVDWERCDKGPVDFDGAFEAIDGFHEKDIYAVGQSGKIWHFDGAVWTPIESPTELPLFSVLCASDGSLYVAGSNGLLFRRINDKWSEHSNASVTKAVIEDLAEFQGDVYVAAGKNLCLLQNGVLVPLDIPVSGTFSSVDLDTCDTALWSVGDECIVRFDGKNWRQYSNPDNA